jgi:hypothetical protein
VIVSCDLAKFLWIYTSPFLWAGVASDDSNNERLSTSMIVALCGKHWVRSMPELNTRALKVAVVWRRQKDRNAQEQKHTNMSGG